MTDKTAPHSHLPHASHREKSTPAHHEKGHQAKAFYRSHTGWISIALAIVLVVMVIASGVKTHRLNDKLADTQKQLTQAKTDATAAQAELDKSKSAATDLQSQLDLAKSQQAQLQTQVDASLVAAAQMKSQLSADQDAAALLQAQLEKGKVHSDELQAQLDQTGAGSTQLLSQLSQEKIHSLDLQAQLQKAESDIAQLQPLLLKSGHMPITTSLEKAQGSRNFTLHVNNLYLQPVSVDTSITGGKAPRSQHDIIGTGATLNIDKLAAGENVVIASEGYDSVKLTVQ
jgi:hypothetical protein